MNRKYTIEEYKNIINKIRNVRPDINFTTDLIVGFPTETEEDFIETYNNLKDIKFSKIHTFPYSKRNNTKAADMEQVDEKIKKERVNIILKLSNELENNYYKLFKNKTLKVLIEETKDNVSIGHTDNYIKIFIEQKLLHNTFYDVKIQEIVNNEVKGIIET